VAASKLQIWNNALYAMGHERLSDTGDPVEAGRVLTRSWDHVVADCLSEASWNFAMETIKAEADTGVTPTFGYTEVFAKPSDWVRTHGVSQDERFAHPLADYYDDQTFWSADVTPIYIRYVSNDTGMGLDLNRWPSAFRRYVELELADRTVLRLNNNQELRERIDKRRDDARKRAKNQDAMNESAVKFLPAGSWTRARSGGGSRNDRGTSGGNLTG
jgi:hypothetical protein